MAHLTGLALARDYTEVAGGPWEPAGILVDNPISPCTLSFIECLIRCLDQPCKTTIRARTEEGGSYANRYNLGYLRILVRYFLSDHRLMNSTGP